MKVVAVACLVCLLGLASAARDLGTRPNMAVNPIHVKLVNEDLRSTWKAGESAFFQDKTFEEAKAMMGTRLDGDHTSDPIMTFDHIDDGEIPTEFDARTNWPGLIHPIRNQERCGSCWAFGAVESLADRFAIATNATSPVLSPEDLVSCDELSLGCSGGLVNLAWRYLEKEGAVTEKCFEYMAGDGHVPPCYIKIHGRCDSAEPLVKYKSKNYYRLSTVEDIQKAIMTGGPVEAGFLVHQSFFAYQSGVYSRAWWDFSDLVAGGHAIKIIGWGVENKVPYWLIANSWGPAWGLDGYFKIKRGVNECFIEETVYGGDPDLNHLA